MKFGMNYFQNRDFIQKPNYADMPLPEIKKWEPTTPAEVFTDDSIQKSKTARGAKNKKGAGGKKVKFAYDLMSNKDKKNYMKERNSVSYNMNEIIPLNAFKMLERSRQKELLSHWLNNGIASKNKLALKIWGISEYKIMQMLIDLGVSYNPPKSSVAEQMKRHHASLSPEEKAELARKQQETKAKKRAERLAEQESLKQLEQTAENMVSVEKAAAERAKIEAEVKAQMKQELDQLYEQANRQAQQLQERSALQAAQQQVQPAQPTIPAMPIITMPDIPAPESAEKFAMKFEINNRSGVMSLEMLGRMLSFMNGDTRTLYKLSINVEEV